MRLRWGLVVVMALLAAACGSEDAPDATQDPGGSTTSTPATIDPATTTPTTIPLVSVDPAELASSPSSTSRPGTTVEVSPPTAPPTSAPIPATTLAPSDQPTIEVIGRGVPQWFSTDGTTVVVAASNNPPSPTCEGTGAPELFRQPLDGEPRSVAVLGVNAGAVGVETRPGPGRVALAEGCLGAPLRLWVGDEAPNGLAARVVNQPLSSAVTTAGIMTPSADGLAFIGSHRPGGTGEPAVVRVDAETGQVATLFAGDYLEVIELADGTFMVLGEGEVRMLGADGTLVDVRDGRAIAASPNRSVYVVFTASTIEVADTDGDSRSVPHPGTSTQQLGTYRPLVDDDGTVVFSRRAGRANPVWELRPNGSVVELLPADEWGDLVATADGALLATSRPAGDSDQPFAEDAVLLTR